MQSKEASGPSPAEVCERYDDRVAREKVDPSSQIYILVMKELLFTLIFQKTIDITAQISRPNMFPPTYLKPE